MLQRGGKKGNANGFFHLEVLGLISKDFTLTNWLHLKVQKNLKLCYYTASDLGTMVYFKAFKLCLSSKLHTQEIQPRSTLDGIQSEKLWILSTVICGIWVTFHLILVKCSHSLLFWFWLVLSLWNHWKKEIPIFLGSLLILYCHVSVYIVEGFFLFERKVESHGQIDGKYLCF